MAQVEALTASIEVRRIDWEGDQHQGFRRFVGVLPGKDGLCHISELSDQYVANVSDVLPRGDRMKVKVIAVDDQEDRVSSATVPRSAS